MSALRSSALLIAVGFAATGCAPSVSLPVLQPALITIPAEVQTVAVIDRSRPKNAGQTVMGAIEGALTGETIAGDNEGRTRAINGAVYVLQESPRFEVVVPSVTKKEVDSDVFDKEWTFRGVKKLCKQHGCDGVLALEAFDTDSFVDAGAIPSNDSKYDPENGVTHFASRRTSVVTAWRFYDASADRTLDYLRDFSRQRTWEQTGNSVANAKQRLPNQTDTIRTVGYEAGQSYARRIAPSWITVRRTYFGGGNPQMKQAKNHVKAGDWEGAVPLWREAANSGDTKLAGKAHFNMALAAEVNGELNKAHNLAKKAAVELPKGKTRKYARALEFRKRQQDKLEEQLAPPEEKPETTNLPDRGEAATTPASDRPDRGEASPPTGNQGGGTKPDMSGPAPR